MDSAQISAHSSQASAPSEGAAESKSFLSVGRASSGDLPPALSPSGQPARPLNYPLADYWRAPADGPLHCTWEDKPHRVVYDLVSGYSYLLASHQRLADALTLCERSIVLIGNACNEEHVSEAVMQRALAAQLECIAAARAALASIPKE